MTTTITVTWIVEAKDVKIVIYQPTDNWLIVSAICVVVDAGISAEKCEPCQKYSFNVLKTIQGEVYAHQENCNSITGHRRVGNDSRERQRPVSAMVIDILLAK